MIEQNSVETSNNKTPLVSGRAEYFPQQVIKDYNALPILLLLNHPKEPNAISIVKTIETVIDVGDDKSFRCQGTKRDLDSEDNETLQSVMATILWSPIESYYSPCGFCSECGIH